MITTSKSPSFNNQAWLSMYSKTQYTGNPFLYPAMQSKSIQLFPSNNSQSRSQTSTIFVKLMSLLLSLSPPSPLFVSWTILKPEQFNCILSTRTKAQNNTQILPYSPMPLKVAQVGNLENIICDLNEVTRRIHQIRLPPNNSLNKNWPYWSYCSKLKTLPERQPQQNWTVLKLYIPICLPIPSITGPPRMQLISMIQ